MRDTILLLIDDDEVDRYLVQRLLARADCDARIVETENGRDALAWLHEHRIEGGAALFILVDLNMPVMGGFDFLAEFSELRASRPDLEPSIVTVLSSSNHPDDLRRSGEFPFVWRHLVKMPTVDTLRDLMEKARA